MLIAHSPAITVKGQKYVLHRAAKTKKIADKLCKELNKEIKENPSIFIDHAIVRYVPITMQHAVITGANWGIWAAYTPHEYIQNHKRVPFSGRK
jgi:hypothetical protein